MTDETNKIKQTRDRSVAYPGVALSDAIEFTERLRNSMGKGPYSRDQVAKALGHPKLSGPAARKVAALVHYGLLERTGNTYSQGQLAQEIYVPLSEEQKMEAIQRAALTPKLFSMLYTRYAGQALPSMLPNIIVRDGVSEGVADEVSKTFVETLTFANLLVNGVLKKSMSGPGNESQPAKSFPSPYSPQDSARTTQTSEGDFVFEFSGGIRLFVPRTKITSEAIADGELKSARQALSTFASSFMPEESTDGNEVEGN